MNRSSRRSFLVFIFCLLLSISILPAEPPDLAKIKIAAESGDPIAQDKLAERFVLRMDTKQAELWYRKSAEQGYAHAQGKLGVMLLHRHRMGHGLPAAERAAAGEEAFKWLALGANQGDAESQGYLADVYYEGKLVKQNLTAAYKWGSLADKGFLPEVGSIVGKSARNSAILKMTPEQIAAAEKELAAFKPEKIAQAPPAAKPLPSGLKLKGIVVSGVATPSIALINTTTFSKGETHTIKVGGQSYSVTCTEIGRDFAVITIQGFEGSHKLQLK